MVAAVACTASGCVFVQGPPKTITYEFDGSGESTDVYYNTLEERVDRDDLDLGRLASDEKTVTYTLPAGKPWYAGMVVSADYGSEGTVSCRILVDGVVVSSDSDDLIAHCTYSVD